jgi:hypothetical protein
MSLVALLVMVLLSARANERSGRFVPVVQENIPIYVFRPPHGKQFKFDSKCNLNPALPPILLAHVI